MMKHKILFLILCGCLMAMSLRAQYQLTPECYVDIEPNRYVIHFTLPNYTLEDEDGNDHEEGNGECEDEDNCGVFSDIVMDDNIEYDITDVFGYPELPFFSLNLLLPECVSNVVVYMEKSEIDQDYPPHFISPATKGRSINEYGEYTELDDKCFNSEYYNYGESANYPHGFYRDYYAISSVCNLFNSTGVTLSIYPFAYYPEYGYMDVLLDAVFVIEFECGDLITTIDEIQASSEYNALVTQLYFDTFNDMDIVNKTINNGRYLIVAAHRDMEEILMPYVHYKQSQNYETEVIYLDDYGIVGNVGMIKDFVNNRSDFVLLVGNLEDIPPCWGIDDADMPYTDDCYHAFLGRWIVGETRGEYDDLRNIINKTIQTEMGYVNSYSLAALFSGTDTQKRVSKKFYRNIKKIAYKSFDPMGIPYTLYDGRNYSQVQGRAYMTNELQSNPRFFVYRGHGYQDANSSGIASPYWLGSSMVYRLTGAIPTPIGFGFACSLNTYNMNGSFGTKWTSSKSGGGVAFYGATTPSYRSSNDCLAKRVFRTLRKMSNKIENFPLSVWLKLSELNYYLALSTWQRGVQIDKYNLIGDPTLAVYGMNNAGSWAPFHMPKHESSNETNELSIVSVDIFDANGRKIASVPDKSDLDVSLAQKGVYLVKTTYIDGTYSIEKFIK